MANMDEKNVKKDDMDIIDELLAMADEEEDAVLIDDGEPEGTEDNTDLSDTIMRDIGELTDPATTDTVVLSFEELQLALEQAKAKMAEKNAEK